MRSRLLVPIAFLVLLGTAAPAGAITIPVGQPAIDTAITGGPLEGSTTEDETPSFSFTATSNGNPFPAAVFQCAVDGEPAEPCTSPFQLPSLEEEGEHTFSVFAEDPDSADRDPSPATRSFFFFTAEEEECEPGEEFEGEEGNFVECEAGETGPAPPPECLLRTARARLFAYTAHEKVRLVIGYTSYAPAEVDVEYRLDSGKGSLKLGEARGHLAKRGLFHLTERLGEAEMAKVRAAKHFTVELDVAAAPSFCRRYETRQLTVKRSAHSQIVWLQSGSAFGSGS
jgi:hypothetical protein